MPAIDAGPTMFHDIGGLIAIASPEPVDGPITVPIAETVDDRRLRKPGDRGRRLAAYGMARVWAGAKAG